MRLLTLTVVLVLFVSSVHAQRPSGNEGKRGWTSDNELMYRQADAVYMQKLQKKAKQEARQGNPSGPMNQQLRNEQQNRSASQYIKDLFSMDKRSNSN